jgi:hypothetical protein
MMITTKRRATLALGVVLAVAAAFVLAPVLAKASIGEERVAAGYARAR